MRNIVFIKPNDYSSLKLIGFSIAMLLNKKDQFAEAVHLDKVPGINKLERVSFNSIL